MGYHIIETLPWVDYKKVYEDTMAEAEARGFAKGLAIAEAKAKAEGKIEVVRSMLRFRAEKGFPESQTVELLLDIAISKEIIDSARASL